jgi:biotin carboxylase
MTRQVLVIGHSTGLIEALARIGAHAPRVYLLVEPSVLKAHPGECEHPLVAEIRTGRFVFSDEAVSVGLGWHVEVGFDAVLPGKEHAVRAAAAIAGTLGLGYPGRKAVGACTDKLEFRRVLADAGFPTPRFRPVDGPADVGKFFDSCDRRPIVLKPRNRNGSLGVRYIDATTDIATAWAESVGTDEGTHKPLDRRFEPEFTYLVEEYLTGPEFSVEMLVADGEIVFTNITEKSVGELPWFPEMGHRVPAVLPGPLHALLLGSARRLGSTLEMRDGLLHSEWRATGERAYPLECAARFPGDRIPWLIELAYGFNLADAWLRCLDHTQDRIEATPRCHAATQFLHVDPGTVVAVNGLEQFMAAHHVLEVSVPRPGDRVAEARDSHSRAGFAVVDAEDRAALNTAIGQFAAVSVETR